MYVQVHDTNAKGQFRSVVYAILEKKEMTGPIVQVEVWAVVLDPREDCFAVIPWRTPGLPLGEKGSNYTVIQPDRSGWEVCSEEQLSALSEFKLVSAAGYADVVGDPVWLSRLLQNGKLPREGSGVRVRAPEDSGSWNYVLSQEDAEALLSRSNHFHDSQIRQILYRETDERSFLAVVQLDTRALGEMELCFEGVIGMNLRTQIHWQREMMSADLTVTDSLVSWVVDSTVAEMHPQSTWIQALSLKWREKE